MRALIWAPCFETICGVPIIHRTLRSLKQAGIQQVFLQDSNYSIEPPAG